MSETYEYNWEVERRTGSHVAQPYTPEDTDAWINYLRIKLPTEEGEEYGQESS